MKIPLSTYRIQLHAAFPFDSASSILPYLQELGISHLYASPILKAKSGSMHGYDVIDPEEINPELGGEEKFNALIEKARSLSIGWIQDIVPNHMAYDSENHSLMDVLEKGKNSLFREYFDVDWDVPYESLHDRLLAPFLGSFYGTCLDNAEIRLHFYEGGFGLCYADSVFPVKVEEYPFLLRLDWMAFEQKIGRGSEECARLLNIIQAFEKIGEVSDLKEQYQRIHTLKSELDDLCREKPLVAEYIDAILKRFNGQANQPATMNELDTLHLRQNFRLSYWKVSNEELNYRRFFTINNLISLNMGRKEVFDFVHKKIFALLSEQKIDGVRIDHLDGLYNPLEYLLRIRQLFPDTYIVAEKILDLFEPLSQCLSLQGTTGYDCLNFINGLFVEKKNEKKWNKMYAAFTHMNRPYDDLVLQKKHVFMDRCLAGDIYYLAYLLKKILGISRYGRDMTAYGLKRAIFEILAHFPVYRTYVFRDHRTYRDEGYIKQAVASAKNSNSTLYNELELIERILLLSYGPETPEPERQEWARFTERFQQTSPALMAKGMEDTIFYSYNRLLSLNEVGGNPSLFGVSIKDFHDYNIRKAHEWPHSLNATATHDTKRGEDVRARLNVLSEMTQEWSIFLKETAKVGKRLKKSLFGNAIPDRNEEYFIYQTMVGAYPFYEEEVPQFHERMKEYMVKALREAKIHTSWNNRDASYEEACVQFIDALFDRARAVHFWDLFLPFQKKISFYAIFNSLSQVLLKVASPGIPDFYQGTELWDLNLVDPDNRREVDFGKRTYFLQQIKRKEHHIASLLQELWSHKEDGRVKLWTIYRLLKARNKLKELFQHGDYMPLEVKGCLQQHVVAFARRYEHSYAIAVAPRLLSKLIQEGELPTGVSLWKDSSLLLPQEFPTTWTHALTGRVATRKNEILIGEILDSFPVGLLIADNYTK